MQELKTAQDIIDALEDLKVATGRTGRYESDMIDLVTKSLAGMKIFTEQDM